MDLVILSDYGLDDAVALTHILANREKFGRIDVAAVAGNTSAETSLANAKKLLARLPGSGVRLVDTTAVRQPWSHLPSIHGRDGMGDLFDAAEPDVPVIPYETWLSDADRPYTLLSLGPCTLTADILDRFGPRPLVVMGGLVNAAPNYKGYEFNHELDKDAFARTVKYPHVIATLDTCRTPRFNRIGRRTAGVTVMDKLINRAIDLAAARHPDNCYIYDWVAAEYCTDPDSFTAAPAVDPWGNRLNQLKGL